MNRQPGVLLLATALALTSPTQAQTGTELEEVVVTARKAEESLLEVPVAVTAFSADDIETLDLDTIGDLQNFTPGFSYESFGTTAGRLDNVPRFRGVTTNTAAPTRQTASVFIDGVFVANGVQGIDFNDIQRIEAIKGPQSAFYGRSTFGGAINFITRTPGDRLALNVSSTIASRDEYEVAAGIEGPISSTIKGRLSGNFRDRGGQYRSTFDGGTVGDEETWAIAGTLFFTPTDAFDAKLRINYFENDDGPPAVGVVGQDLLNCGPTSFEADPSFPALTAGQPGPIGGREAFFCGTLPAPAANIPTILPDAIQATLADLGTLNGPGSRRENDGFGLDRQSLRFSLQLNYEFDNGLTLSSITGINEEEVNQLRAGEGNNLGPPAFFAPNSRRFEDVSQELRLAGSAQSDKLLWSVGANYFEQELTTSGTFGTFGGFPFGTGNNRDGEEITTTGLFGSISYQLSDQFRATLEGRYQEDEVVEDGDVTDTTPGLEETFSNFLPRLIVEFTPVEGRLFYLSYSEGNLPGGFNNDFIELNQADRDIIVGIQPFSSETFDEEELVQFELGWKQSFSSGSIATALFHLDRKGQTVRETTQATLSTGPEFINQFLNIGRSEGIGVEVEGVWRPTERLTIDATVSYLDSEFRDFASANVLRARGNAAADGFRSERFPEYQGSLSWQYEGQVNSDWSWYFRNDNSFLGQRFASEVNLAEADAALISNVRLGFRSDRLLVEAFVSNLTDEDSPLAAVRSTDLGSVVTRTAGARPFDFLIGLRERQQYGIRFRYNQ